MTQPFVDLTTACADLVQGHRVELRWITGDEVAPAGFQTSSAWAHKWRSEAA